MGQVRSVSTRSTLEGWSEPAKAIVKTGVNKLDYALWPLDLPTRQAMTQLLENLVLYITAGHAQERPLPVCWVYLTYFWKNPILTLKTAVPLRLIDSHISLFVTFPEVLNVKLTDIDDDDDLPASSKRVDSKYKEEQQTDQQELRPSSRPVPLTTPSICSSSPIPTMSLV